MRTHIRRLMKIEATLQEVAEARPYRIKSLDGRVECHVTPLPGRLPAVVLIAYVDDPSDMIEGRAAVDGLFPAGWNGMLFPRTLTREEWEKKYGDEYGLNNH